MRIGILDDDASDRKRLEGYLERYMSEHGRQMKVDVFSNSLEFAEKYRGGYDIVFLDIEMPGLSGIEVAREIRRSDETAGIIFITNMAQYAIKGYEVNAIDFMVKPVGYYNFADKMDKALWFAQKRRNWHILINSKESAAKISIQSILYIEKDKNYLVYHTEKGDFRSRGTISEIKEKLKGAPFAECTGGCLVNLHHIGEVERDVIVLDTQDKICLPLSRRMKKAFMQEMISHLGGIF